MDNVITKVVNLPVTISGYTLRDRNGDFTIYLNSRLSWERQLKTYRHEVEHISRGDFDLRSSADLIEIYAHKNNYREEKDG